MAGVAVRQQNPEQAGEISAMTPRREPIEIICPQCKRTAIIYLPDEDVPLCQTCGRQMIIREVLREGKSY